MLRNPLQVRHISRHRLVPMASTYYGKYNWSANGTNARMSKRRRTEQPPSNPAPQMDDGGDDGDGGMPLPMPFLFPKMLNQSSIYCHTNHVFFNDDITSESAFALNRELRQLELKLREVALNLSADAPPIYLHLTTNGGCIHSAFTVIDTIQSLKVPVHTVVEGFVASAGTLISLAGEKRYMTRNAYMLIHELRSGVWGKMTSLEEEYTNLRKIMDHITRYYLERSRINKRSLEKILAKDLIWDVDECIEKGIVDEIYKR